MHYPKEILFSVNFPISAHCEWEEGAFYKGIIKADCRLLKKISLLCCMKLLQKRSLNFFFSTKFVSTFFRADSMPWDKNRSIFFKLKAPQKQRSTLGHSFSYVNQAFILKKQLSLINLFSDKCWYFWNPSKWAIIKTFISNSQKRHKMNRKSWIWF